MALCKPAVAACAVAMVIMMGMYRWSLYGGSGMTGDTLSMLQKAGDGVPQTQDGLIRTRAASVVKVKAAERVVVYENVLPAVTGENHDLYMTRVDVGPERKLANKGGPMDYLPDYQNPCWMSSFQKTTKGVNPYTGSPYITQWVKRYRYSKTWWPLFSSFMKNMTARVSAGQNWRVRCTPGLYLIGSSKSGTSDLFFKLVTHPDIHEPAVKEPLWWVHGRFGGVSYSRYLDSYDRAGEMMQQKTITKDGKPFHPGYTVDASSWYIYSQDYCRKLPGNKGLKEPKYVMAHALKALHPGTKILAIVREPAARLYSQYRMKFKNKPPEHFDELAHHHVTRWKACIAEHGLRRCAYQPMDGVDLRTGMFMRASIYFPYIRDWYDVMGSHNVKIIRAEDYYADRATVLQEIYRFLGLDALPQAVANTLNNSVVSNSGKSWSRSPVPMLNSTKSLLNEFFSPINAQLAELMSDDRFLWRGY